MEKRKGENVYKVSEGARDVETCVGEMCELEGGGGMTGDDGESFK